MWIDGQKVGGHAASNNSRPCEARSVFRELQLGGKRSMWRAQAGTLRLHWDSQNKRLPHGLHYLLGQLYLYPFGCEQHQVGEVPCGNLYDVIFEWLPDCA